MTTIQAIETRYAGCHFRSRLEARWAVFFDHLNIAWQYEPEGFVGCHGTPYLPDFYLPELRSWVTGATGDQGVYVEVKGSQSQLENDSYKIGQCIDYNHTPLGKTGLLILGDVPRAGHTDTVTHSYCYWRKGVETEQVAFGTRTRADQRTIAYIDTPPGHPASRLSGNTSEELPPRCWTEALVWPQIGFRRGGESLVFRADPRPNVIDAYNAARSARFEHGQSGAT